MSNFFIYPNFNLTQPGRVAKVFLGVVTFSTLALAMLFSLAPLSYAAAPQGTLTGATQTLTVGTPAAINTITVTDHSTAEITTVNDILIQIPSAANFIWDESDTTATIGNPATGVVSGTVSYPDSKTLLLDVTTGFANSEAVTISDLSFIPTAATTATALDWSIDAGGAYGNGNANTQVTVNALTTLTQDINASAVATVGDSTGQVTMDITFPAPMVTGDTIEITFPANWDISTLTTGAGQNYNLDNTVNVGVAAQVLTLTLEGAQGATAETINFETDTITPKYADDTLTILTLLENAAGDDIVAAAANTGVAEAIDDSIAADSNGATSVTNIATVGSVGTMTVTAETPLALAVGDYIEITFPANYDISGVNTVADNVTSTYTGTPTFTASLPGGQVLRLTLATGTTAVESGVLTVTDVIAGYASAAGTITATVFESGGNILSTSTDGTIAASTAGDTVASIDVSNITTVGNSGTVALTIDTQLPLAVNDYIEVTFPANYDISGVDLTADVVSSTYTGNPTFTASLPGGQVLRLTLSAGTTAAESGVMTIPVGIEASSIAVASTLTTTVFDSAGNTIATANDDPIAATIAPVVVTPTTSSGGGGHSAEYLCLINNINCPEDEPVLEEIVEENSTVEPFSSQDSNTKEDIATPFTDISNHSAKKAIELLFSKGVISGKTLSLYAPEDEITRAEAGKIALNTGGISLPSSVSSSPFIDLSLEHWSLYYMQAAKDERIFEGFKDGTLQADRAISKAEALKVLLIANGLDELKQGTVIFSDMEDHWAKKYVDIATYYGIVVDDGSGIFNPDRYLTRGEMAQMAVKTLEVKIL